MSASGLQIITFEYPEDTISSQSTSQFQRVNSSISFDYLVHGNVVTLSSNTATSGTDLVGFLYYPALGAGNTCTNASAQYVPSNVTREADLPPAYDAVAIAPWISPSCTLSYLNVVQTNSDVTALIFFIPGQGAQTPPSPNDAAWDLGDGGQWKSDNHYPVYAIPSSDAETILDQMANYSGNLTSAPYADQLITIYKPSDYVRLYVDINLAGSGGLPSIWVFLLIILAILLALIGLMSLCLHFMQRRRRSALRRRIVNGELDVETLGIKRLTVPQDRIDKMPVYPYRVNTGQAQTTSDDMIVGAKGVPGDHGAVKDESAIRVSQASAPGLYQPACAICLDDFVAGESQVRELPCKHIFHPECIDMFLLENSSLCPLCKTSVLPPGYCPTKITNQMVRRERNARRVSERRSQSAAYVNSQASAPHRLRYGPFFRRENQSLSDTNNPPGGTVEMVDMPAVPQGPPPVNGRREWARRRALAMLGPRAPPTDIAGEDDAQQRASGPRKFLGRVLPGIGWGRNPS